MIAVVYARAGGATPSMGHAVLARNYENFFRETSYECVSIDVMEGAGGPLVSFGRGFYSNMLRYSPAGWRWIQRNWQSIPGAKWYRHSILPSRFPHARLRLLDLAPKVIISTHPFSTSLVASMKRKKETNAKLIVASGDWAYQPYCCYPEVDHYFASCDTQRIAMVDDGIDKSKITALGTLVPSSFYRLAHCPPAREKLGLPDGGKVLLVMSGAWGFRLNQMVRPLLSLGDEYRLVVMCGSGKMDDTCRAQIESKGGIVVGYVDDPTPYYAAADLLITKPGGMTPVQALAAGLRMLLVEPMPGHEEDNMNALVFEGFAERVKPGEPIAEAIRRALDQPRPFTRWTTPQTRVNLLKHIANLLKVPLD